MVEPGDGVGQRWKGDGKSELKERKTRSGRGELAARQLYTEDTEYAQRCSLAPIILLSYSTTNPS